VPCHAPPRPADPFVEAVKKLRVLHLIKSLNRGGAETLLAEGLRFVDRDRFEMSYGFFHPGLCALAPTLGAAGVDVTCFGGHNHPTMLARATSIARHLRKHRIDLLHCHLPMAGVVGRLAARMADVPLVYTEHNKPEWYRKPTFLLNAMTYSLQAEVIAVSASVEQSIRVHLRARVPVTVVRNGIDSSCFVRRNGDGERIRRRLGIPSESRVIGNVAALIPQKCLHDWVEAARMIHEHDDSTRFVLVGEGPELRALTRQIAAHGLQDIIHLCGGQPVVREYLAAMDIYMMSSAYEGLPVALLEAMAMRCVPVCTAVGGIPEVIRDGQNGFLSEVGHPEQLARHVGELLREHDRRRAIASAAIRTVTDDFRLDRMVQDVESIYLRVLNQRRPPRF
jgi:glycosyltransferase involved in cell wall biosynthesis